MFVYVMCMVYAHTCVQVHILIHPSAQPKVDVVLCCVLPLCLIPSRRGLLLNLQLGCQPISPKEHVPAPNSARVTVFAATHSFLM